MTLTRGEDGARTAGGGSDAWGIAQRLLGADRVVPCRVLGGSMAPFLGHNDLIWLRPITAADLRPGDVVLYRSGAGRIVHRFLRRERVDGHEVLTMRGDAMRQHDPPVLASQVLGKVVRVDKGTLTLDLESGWGRLLNVAMVVLPSCPGLLGSIRIIWRLLVRRKSREPISRRVFGTQRE